MVRGLLSDDEWAFFEPFVIERGALRGRPPCDHRRTLNAVFWIACTGAPWRDLPEELGNWNSVHRQYRRWTRATKDDGEEGQGWAGWASEHIGLGLVSGAPVVRDVATALGHAMEYRMSSAAAYSLSEQRSIRPFRRFSRVMMQLIID